MALVRSAGGVLYDPQLPESLASEAGLDLKTYALARLIASEGYSGSSWERPNALAGIAHAALNEAARRGTSLQNLLLSSQDLEASGRFGEQHKRWASTRKEPTSESRRVARDVLSGAVSDATGGATAFLDPSVWARGSQAGRSLRTLSEVLSSWAESRQWVGRVEGTTPDYIAFFRPSRDEAANRASMQDLLGLVGGGQGISLALLFVAAGAAFVLLKGVV